MKGKIDKSGRLSIERHGQMVLMSCKSSPELTICAHDCPAFGEPYQDLIRGQPLYHKTGLQLCRNVGLLVFREFHDEREQKE